MSNVRPFQVDTVQDPNELWLFGRWTTGAFVHGGIVGHVQSMFLRVANQDLLHSTKYVGPFGMRCLGNLCLRARSELPPL